MFRFVIRKMVSKKWMVLALLIGNILLISITSGNPMYTQAVLQRTLNFPVGIAFCHAFPLVMELLATCNRQLHLHQGVFLKVHAQRNQGHSPFAHRPR